MTAPAAPILFNSATGSDSLASGLGPTTAINSTTESTTASYSGTTITFSGATDLSGVTAGHLLYLLTSTGRKFFVIASVDDGANTLVVDDTPTGTASGLNWAIGGKRQYLCSVGASELLFDNGGSTGDSKPGWIMRMESGHDETFSNVVDFRGLGTPTTGVVIIEGDPSAEVRPILRSNLNSTCFVGRSQSGPIFRHFKIINIHATKTASVAFGVGSSGSFDIDDVIVGDTTNYFWKAATGDAGFRFVISNSVIDSCASHGINVNDELKIRNCRIINCGGSGVYQSGSTGPPTIHDTIIANNGGYGVYLGNSGFSDAGLFELIGCIIDGNASDGVYINDATMRCWNRMCLVQNLITYNGGNGIGALTNGEIYQSTYGTTFNFNAFYGNVGTQLSNLSDHSTNITLTADPYIDRDGGDYNINSTEGGGQLLREATKTLP